MTRRRLLILPILLIGLASARCGTRQPETPKLNELHRASSAGIDVALLTPTEALKQTRNYCTLEFRTAADRQLVDVGSVSVRTTMTMEGEPMAGVVTEPKRIDAGRYEVQMVLAMTGAWQIVVEWDGPAGKGSVTFADNVK